MKINNYILFFSFFLALIFALCSPRFDTDFHKTSHFNRVEAGPLPLACPEPNDQRDFWFRAPPPAYYINLTNLSLSASLLCNPVNVSTTCPFLKKTKVGILITSYFCAVFGA